MTTFKRICIQDYEERAANGDHFEVRRGEEVLTSDVREDGTVIVFRQFWVPVPATHFAGEVRFT